MSAPGWAIVTGASSGIGKALAFEFAKGGFHLFLTGRNETALAQVAAECSKTFHVTTEIFSADLSRLDSIDKLITALTSNSRRYEVLANNAGFGIHAEFASSDIDQELQLLNLQLAAALKLTKSVLPSMIANRSGRILNVSSVYGFAPVPHQSVYSACKAFLLSFSTSLRNELEGTGVTVTVFCPGITQSEFRNRAGIAVKNKNSGMTAEAAAQIAYSETMRGKAIVVPGLPNRLFVLASRLLPSATFAKVVKLINRRRGLADDSAA
jgi:short-subunit dehydrogenase